VLDCKNVTQERSATLKKCRKNGVFVALLARLRHGADHHGALVVFLTCSLPFSFCCLARKNLASFVLSYARHRVVFARASFVCLSFRFCFFPSFCSFRFSFALLRWSWELL
jgi:hypothetical protein